MSERDLPVIAGENVKPEHGDGVNHHLSQLENVIIAEREGQHDRERNQYGAAKPSPGGYARPGLAG